MAHEFQIENPDNPNEYRAKIAKFSNIPLEDVDAYEIQDFSNSGERSSYLNSKYMPKDASGQRIEGIYLQQLTHWGEGLNDLDAHWQSYGLAVESYLEGLNYVKKIRSKYDPPHHALLAGANNYDSVFHFNQTVTSIFPNAKCFLGDIDISLFSLPNVNLPIPTIQTNLTLSGIKSGSMDSIHSNYLLSFMTDPKEALRFIKESQRTLKHGGVLIIVDGDIFDLNLIGFIPRSFAS